jgi:two-component system OmpR family response regulator
MPVKPTVLVAEDDVGVRDILRARLHQMGLEVDVARNGREALDRIIAWRPAAVVLDINMPELDGFGVLEALQKRGLKPPPTLVLTARHTGDDVRRAIKLGAKDYLTKPFSEAQLQARMGRLFRSVTPAG